jgi:hypothetical protein
MSWNGYWDKYKDSWASSVNSLNTTPDEIIIVSDVKIDTSALKHNNIKNIVVPNYYEKRPASTYRNIAIDNATSDWVVSADIDDEFNAWFLDSLPDDSDIHGFSFLDKYSGETFRQDHRSLEYRLTGADVPGNLIPSCSAIKKSVFDSIRYEHGCHEDNIFYAMASKLDIKFTYDSSDMPPRYIYSGWHTQNEEIDRVTKIYKEMISGSNRPVYAFWFSDTISENRKAGLKVLNKSAKNLILLNTQRFYSFENKEIPIHKGFKYLTANHKSDYARAYMMYFYGGGYSDVKPNDFNWGPYFDELFLSKGDVIGYAEKHENDVAFYPNNSEEKAFLETNYNKFIGNGHYIFKPKTDIVFRWITEIHRIIDQNYERLASHPGQMRHINDSDYDQLASSGYPLEWNELGGRILHRLQYEYSLKNILTGMPFTNNVNYR